jgi:putative ABC transport system permease protein
LFGLAPAWQSTGTRLVQVMTAEGRGTTKAGGRLRSGLVIAEVAAAVLLLCGAGLMLRSLAALADVEGGARADDALTLRVALSYGAPQSRHKTPASLHEFYRRVEQEVTALPDVRAAGWGSGLPLGGVFYSGFNVTILDQPGDQGGNRPAVDYMLVSPGYLHALDVPVLAGRSFDERDSAGSAPVCLVSAGFVRKHLGGRNPLGVRVAVGQMALTLGSPVVREIVGVVAPIRPSPDADASDQLYVPIAQNPWANSVLVVRPTSGPASALAPAVRAAIARIDPEQPVTRVLTLDDVAWSTIARPRFRTVLVAIFAALALVLAMIGVFGVLAYSVQQRWREFGVRIALGASVGHVLRQVAGAAATVVGLGIVAGLVAAAALSSSISAFLFGVPPLDAVTFGGVATVLVVTGAIAALVPALRASRVDPVVAFRND